MAIVRAPLSFSSSGVVGIPDRPGVDAAALERRLGIGRLQEDRLGVAPLETARVQRADQERVGARALGHGHLLAGQIGGGLNRRIGGHDDRLGARGGFAGQGVDEIGAGRLGEDRRRRAGGAEVDGCRRSALPAAAVPTETRSSVTV